MKDIITQKDIEALEFYKLASPPSKYSDQEAECWSVGVSFIVEKIMEALKEKLNQ